MREPPEALVLIRTQRRVEVSGDRALGELARDGQAGHRRPPRRRLGVDNAQRLELGPQVDVIPIDADPLAPVLLQPARLVDERPQVQQLRLVQAQVGTAVEDEDLVAACERSEQLVEGNGLPVDGHGDGKVEPVPVAGALGAGDGDERSGRRLPVVDRSTDHRDEHVVLRAQSRQRIAREGKHRHADEHGHTGEPPARCGGRAQMWEGVDHPVDARQQACLRLLVAHDPVVPASSRPQADARRPFPLLAFADVSPLPREFGSRRATVLNLQFEHRARERREYEGFVVTADGVMRSQDGKRLASEGRNLLSWHAHRRLRRQRRRRVVEHVCEPTQTEADRFPADTDVPGERARCRAADEAEPFDDHRFTVHADRHADEQVAVALDDVDAGLDRPRRQHRRRLVAGVEDERDVGCRQLLEHVPDDRRVHAIQVQPRITLQIREVDGMQGCQLTKERALLGCSSVARVPEILPIRAALNPPVISNAVHDGSRVEPGLRATLVIATRRRRELDAELQTKRAWITRRW